MHGREEKLVQGFDGKSEVKRSLRRPRCRWEEILKWTLRKQDEVVQSGLIRLWIGASDGFCEHGNEPLGSINFFEILE
jgi:hypothetical protein